MLDVLVFPRVSGGGAAICGGNQRNCGGFTGVTQSYPRIILSLITATYKNVRGLRGQIVDSGE